MPLYANTHTLQSASGKQTSNVREEAREIIKRVCNANEDHCLIFCGTGATSAVNLLVNRLKIKQICENVKLNLALDKVVVPVENQNTKE